MNFIGRVMCVLTLLSAAHFGHTQKDSDQKETDSENFISSIGDWIDQIVPSNKKGMGQLVADDLEQIQTQYQASFFGINVKWKVVAPVAAFTNYSAIFQFAYPVFLPFNMYDLEDEKERSDKNVNGKADQITVLRRRRREARDERADFFKRMESIVGKLGLPTEPCVLRTICEVAETPFAESFLGDTLNVVFQASGMGRPEHPDEGTEYNKYIDAEYQGKNYGNCHRRYNECPASVMDFFPSIVKKILV